MMKYKLYKHKKQWVVAGTALLASITLGATACANADTINHAGQQEPTTETSISRQQLAGHSTPSSSNNSSNSDEGSLSTSHDQDNGRVMQSTEQQLSSQSRNEQPASQIHSSENSRQSSRQPTDQSRNSQQTQAPYGTKINPDLYTVTLNVPGLSYTIPPYKLVNGDLRFATDEEVSHINGWHQPALINGKPENVGTYIVFLSQEGFNHLEAWLNGEEVDGRWVARSDVHNITLGTYNLQFLFNMWLNGGRATFTVAPYHVKVELSGNAPLGTDGLDLSQYHVSLVNGEESQMPIDKFEEAFNRVFHLTNGDLQVSSTPLEDGKYQVTLTEQGWNNIYIALERVYKSYGQVDHAPNFVCNKADLIVNATATLPEPEIRTITRTIKEFVPHASQPVTVVQTVTLTRYALVEDGKLGWGDWTTGQWEKVIVPVIPGYVASQTDVPAEKVTAGMTDDTIDITYTRQADNGTSPSVGGNGTSAKSPAGRTASSADHSQSVNGQHQLPQTGSNDNWTLAALGGAAFMGMLGLVGSRKRRH